MQAAQGVTDDVKMAASNVLVALARSHFHFVMSELQSHLKATGKVPDQTVLLTMGKMAGSYALQCIPFVGMTMLALRTMLSQVGSGRILRAICSVVEEWSKGVNAYLCNQEQFPFPREGLVAQFCGAIYPIFHYAAVNWLGFKEEEDSQAVLGAVAAMAEVLLHEERHRECSWELVLWLLQHYREASDTSVVTKSLNYVLEMLEGPQTPLTQDMALAISTAVHGQLSYVTKESGLAHKAVLSRCIMLQARICPEETVTFLRSQLSGGSEAGRVAALGMLVTLCHSDALVMRQKLTQVVKDVLMCKARAWVPGEAAVRRAVLEFIRELFSTGSLNCWTWDMVEYIFTSFSQTSGRLAAGGLFAWETQEDGALRALCMDIMGSLDVSLRGMTKLLWPRLLQFVVPAQYSGMLIPLSQCLRALVARREREGCREEEEEPDAMDSQEQAQLPAPQALLARLVVVAAAPHSSSDRAVAALQLLQALQGRIHRALGAVWVTEIPLLLQYLAGNKESSLGSAEWEHHVLKFLQVSLERIKDNAWTVDLWQELSQQLGSSAPGSWERLFLYKVLGTVLAACQNLGHVQGQVLSFLQATDPVSEPQAMISVVSHTAKSHFHLVLDTLTMYSDNFIRLCIGQTCMGSKAQQQQRMETAQPFCAALMRTYSAIALHAPKEQLLSRVDKEILGDILRLSGAAQRGLQLKLALVQSITEVCCAIQAVGDCGSFKLSSKQEAMRTLLDWIKREPWDSVLYGVFQALEKLSKLMPPLSREENQNLLSVCCQAVVSYPSEEQMKKKNRIARAALNTQLLHRRGMQDLGHLIETLLETQGSFACFDDIVHVLKGRLTSAMEWKRERALRVCAHLLDVCKNRHEFRRGCPCQQLGSLVGLLACLTIDCLPTSRQRAGLCLSYLLEMQDNTVPVILEAYEIRCLFEELDSPDPDLLVKTTIKIAKAVCKCFPPAQAVDFLRAIVDSSLHVTTAQEASVIWKWVFIFLRECGKDILAEVPEFLSTLYTYMQRGIYKYFVPAAVSILAVCHQEAVVSWLLQAGHLMDSNMMELWRNLGRRAFRSQILRCLVEKLNRAGNKCPGTGSSACEQLSQETALETLAITRAISEMVFVMSSTTHLRQLLPHIFPSLLRWASETVGEERLPSAMSSWRQLFLEGRMLEQKPCRIFFLALKSVLEKCMEQKWMHLLMHQEVWARLQDPLTHPEGVSLLTRVLLQAGLISPPLVQNLLPWLDSSSVKLRVAAAAFFDEIPQSYRTRRPSERSRN